MSIPRLGRPLLHVAVDTPNGELTGERLVGDLEEGAQRAAVLGERLPSGGRFGVEVWFTGVDGPIRVVLSIIGRRPAAASGAEAAAQPRPALRLIGTTATVR